MPAQVTTRAQVNGYRFVLRRLEHALIRGDSRMIHDPMRGQMRALMVGMVIAVLISGAAGVLAFFKPAPNFGDSTIMLSKSRGEMFVRIGDRLHPALNLASARLIAGKGDPPKEVDDKFLNTVARGPMVGIVGAPNGIGSGDDMATSSWTVCDTTQLPSAGDRGGASTVETTVLANDPELGSDIRAASPQQMILTSAGGTTFLIYDGVRAALDPANPILHSALRLGDTEIREISRGLLNSFPLVDPIVPIVIAGIGEPTTYLPSTYRVGSVLKTVDSRGERALRGAARRAPARLRGHCRHHPVRQPAVADRGRPGRRLARGDQRGPRRAHVGGESLSGGIAAFRPRRLGPSGVHVVATRQLGRRARHRSACRTTASATRRRAAPAPGDRRRRRTWPG